MKKENFQRLYGIPEKTFKYMIKILEKEDIKKMKLGGRPSKLTIEQKLKMTLQYWRQYRTYFEIGLDFGISESVAYKNIIWVEDTLIKSGEFNLPTREEVMKEKNPILIDVTETKIERPKKKQKKFIRVRKSNTRLKHR
jgi:hypothetical protein